MTVLALVVVALSRALPVDPTSREASARPSTLRSPSTTTDASPLVSSATGPSGPTAATDPTDPEGAPGPTTTLDGDTTDGGAAVTDDRPASPGGDLEHDYFGAGPKVAILGDSLTVQSRARLRELLADQSLKVAALYGEGMSGGPISARFGGPIMETMVEEYSDDPPEVLVVALGTNDVWQPGLDPDGFERSWTTMARTFGDACIVGVTATETTEAWNYDPDDAVEVNRVIRRGADVVVDWAELGADPAYTGVDHIHLTDAGQERFASLIGRGVERCLGR